MREIADRGGDAPGGGHRATVARSSYAPAEQTRVLTASDTHSGADARDGGQTRDDAQRPGAAVKKRGRKAASEGGLCRHDAQHMIAPLAPNSPIPATKRGRSGQSSTVAHLDSATPQHTASDGGENGLVDRGVHTRTAVLETRVAREGDAGGGRGSRDILTGLAFSPTNSIGHADSDAPYGFADGGLDLCMCATLAPRVEPTLIAEIVSLHREHLGLQSARVAMDLRISAEARWKAAQRVMSEGGTIGTKFPPVIAEDIEWVHRVRSRYFIAQANLEATRKDCQKALIAETRKLPVYRVIGQPEWRGFGEASLAAVIGETGDLGNYAGPAKVWKRLGLAVFDGKSQRKSKDDAERQGYSPKRRSVMHIIGENLLRSGGPYADLYRAYKARKTAEWAALGIDVVPAARAKPGQETSGHLHKMALRIIEKRLLRDLWRAWRGRLPVDTHPYAAPAELLETVA